MNHAVFPRIASPVLAILLSCCGLAAAEVNVANPEFDQGTDKPLGWTLSGGQGRWVEKQILEVTSQGKGSNYWRSENLRFEPRGLYRFQMRARRGEGTGLVVSGPAIANRDYSAIPQDWTWLGHVFRTPDNGSESFLRLGQWEAKGTVQFDAVRLAPVLPVHRTVGDLPLGEGESVIAGRYQFLGSFDHEGSNYHRVLESANAGFNSDRWCFSTGSQVIYKFSLPGHPLKDAQVSFNVNYCPATSSSCVAEVSRDNTKWTTVARQSGVGTASATIPAEFFPAATIYLRLRAEGEKCNFQVNRVEFTAACEGALTDGSGETLFADLPSPELADWVAGLRLHDDSSRGHLALHLKPNRRELLGKTATWIGRVVPAEGSSPEKFMALDAIDAGQGEERALAIPTLPPGRFAIELQLAFRDGRKLPLSIPLTVPELYRSDYGERIDLPTREMRPAGAAKVLTNEPSVWWCDATWKVARGRPVPEKTAAAARLAAAKNDREAVQIVVRPVHPLKGLTASASSLEGPGGARIPAENVKILRVHYHYVQHPTDKTGVRDWWPDALPPAAKPIDVAAGENQPLWVLVHVPEDAKAGDYDGAIELKAQHWSARVPIKLHVWDFALPRRNHLETAFGLSPHEIFRYHQLKTDEDKRKVLDLYFQSFAEHRISPYDPTPLDPIRVKFLPDANPPRAEVDFSAFDAAMARAVEQFNFTNFRLPIQGMGGGTFHDRVDPKIARFGEDSPQYQAMFASQIKQIEDHLRARRWLDMAYVYWFDEPDPKDFDFVRAGMERLKRFAPGIPRMLTEEPVDALAGAVEIWCPVSSNYDHAAAEKRREKGERFWWYVCCGPKEPYCTLFIDHPATELRVWHWQTWQRKIVGTLVWASNYWTSSAAYPDSPQNPYEDPMGYVSGYSTPKGTKKFWGNGDGRFLYPPESAAVPGLLGPDPVIQPPVSSIRWEMLREGVEDYEYLWLLRDLLAKNRDKLSAEQAKRYESLLEVPASITSEMTKFTTDSAPIYARRAQIAEAIEALSK